MQPPTTGVSRPALLMAHPKCSNIGSPLNTLRPLPIRYTAPTVVQAPTGSENAAPYYAKAKTALNGSSVPLNTYTTREPKTRRYRQGAELPPQFPPTHTLPILEPTKIADRTGNCRSGKQGFRYPTRKMIRTTLEPCLRTIDISTSRID